MAKTLQTGIDDTLQLMDEWSNNGTVQSQSSGNMRDYILRMPMLFDNAQKRIAGVKSIRKVIEFVQKIPENQISTADNQFDIITFEGNDLVFETIGSRAFNFEVDNNFHFVAEIPSESGFSFGLAEKTQADYPNFVPGVFNRVYGMLDPVPDATDRIRIKFTGDTMYNIRNFAMWDERFSGVERIPDYREYMRYPMPSNFSRLKRITFNGQAVTGDAYEVNPVCYWENNTLVARFDQVGVFRVEYAAYPTTITSSTPTTYQFEVDDDAVDGIFEFAASQLLAKDPSGIGDKLYALFQARLENLDDNRDKPQDHVQNGFFTPTTNKLFS